MTEKQELEQESPLKKRREELGLTQRDVAGAVDVSVQTISNWETGRYKEAKLTLPQVKALCRVLRWTIEDLPDDLASPRSQSEDD
jgi:DNA-binding XRE family transcriptional regulator